MYLLQNLHNSAWNGFLTGGSTFGFWLDTLCLLYLTVVIFVFLFIDFGTFKNTLIYRSLYISLLVASKCSQFVIPHKLIRFV